MGNKSRTLQILGALMLVVAFPFAYAHDASTYGGLFRSRDKGQSWFSIDTGVFIGGALGVAVHPTDPSHLLMATDAGLLRSRNGGRDWLREAPEQFAGPVFAAAFSDDGRSAWAGTGDRVLRSDEAGNWASTHAPNDAVPTQAIAASAAAPRVYLVGLESFFVSDDGGGNWSRAANGLPEGEIAAFSIAPQPKEMLYLVVNGALWMSEDGAHNWRQRGAGLPSGRVDMVYAQPRDAQRVYALAQAQLYVSEDAGATWRTQGTALPESRLVVRGLAVTADAKVIMTTTHKGLYRSADGAETWSLVESNLPIHLEAGPLAAERHDANTFYAGYALTPYGETWRRALEARAQRPQTSRSGGLRWLATAALLLLIALTAWAWRTSQLRTGKHGDDASKGERR